MDNTETYGKKIENNFQESNAKYSGKKNSLVGSNKNFINAIDILKCYYPIKDILKTNNFGDLADWNNTEWAKWGDFGKFNNVL